MTKVKDDLDLAICESLGLKDVITLDLHLKVDKWPTINVTMYPKNPMLELLPPILKKYKLVPLEDDG